jgi:hypothetical protein
LNHIGAVFTLAGLGVLAWHLGPAFGVLFLLAVVLLVRSS